MKPKIVKSPSLTIYDNILKYKNTVIKLSNISRCEIAPKPKTPYPIWLFIGLIAGFFLIMENEPRFAAILIGICSIILIAILYANSNPAVYLILELNSGSIITFSCEDPDFLLEAQKEIIDYFNYKEGPCIINLSKCTITHSQIGEKNAMYNQHRR